MSKKIIAVDIDEVLFPNLDMLLPYFNDAFGTSIKKEQMVSYYWEDITGEPTESVVEKIRGYLESAAYDDNARVEKAVESIQRLQDKFELYVVTSRQLFWREYTEKFIEKHFAGVFKELHYTQVAKDSHSYRPKYKVCQQIGAHYLIDDQLANVMKCAENGITGMLFGDYPWNQADELPENVIRCSDWPAVLEYLEATS